MHNFISSALKISSNQAEHSLKYSTQKNRKQNSTQKVLTLYAKKQQMEMSEMII